MTLIDFYHPSDLSLNQKTIIFRKRLNKILPLNIKYDDRLTRNNIKIDKKYVSNHFSIKILLIVETKKSILQGHKVKMTTYLIPNKEIVQIF